MAALAMGTEYRSLHAERVETPGNGQPPPRVRTGAPMPYLPPELVRTSWTIMTVCLVLSSTRGESTLRWQSPAALG